MLLTQSLGDEIPGIPSATRERSNQRLVDESRMKELLLVFMFGVVVIVHVQLLVLLFMEPENTPLEKENHLPNHHVQVPC